MTDIALKEIDHKFGTGFETYLRTVSKCNENTTAKFIQTFRMIVIVAKNNGWIFHINTQKKPKNVFYKVPTPLV